MDLLTTLAASQPMLCVLFQFKVAILVDIRRREESALVTEDLSNLRLRFAGGGGLFGAFRGMVTMLAGFTVFIIAIAAAMLLFTSLREIHAVVVFLLIFTKIHLQKHS